MPPIYLGRPANEFRAALAKLSPRMCLGAGAKSVEAFLREEDLPFEREALRAGFKEVAHEPEQLEMVERDCGTVACATCVTCGQITEISEVQGLIRVAFNVNAADVQTCVAVHLMPYDIQPRNVARTQALS